MKPKTKPPVLVAFGQAVRQRRTELGYSQETFADAAEIDRSYMGGVERGERNLSMLNISRIIATLKIEPSAFFRDLDSDRMPQLLATEANIKDKAKLVKVAKEKGIDLRKTKTQGKFL